MSEKLNAYIGVTGRFHNIKDNLKDRWSEYKSGNDAGVSNWIRCKINGSSEDCHQDTAVEYAHIYRKKSRIELVRISAAVMGIEFSYAAETAFVSPTLLKIGVQHKHMSLIWGLSPIIGFFLTPILGSLSDRCPMKWGRRRPFILMLAIGVLLGLILVPNGEGLGYLVGDERPANASSFLKYHGRATAIANFTEPEIIGSHPWGLAFTILGTVLLDFNADSCQSPARAYLLDITTSEDHARGLSTFTVMAGLGGFMGYSMGGMNWDATKIGLMLGGHVRAVFTLITIIFIICVACTLTSFKEIPLTLLNESIELKKSSEASNLQKNVNGTLPSYGTAVDETSLQSTDLEGPPSQTSSTPTEISTPQTSIFTYLKSIICMPISIQIVCLTNLFCWMSHICYSLYFTDFVGEAVFNGIPTAPEDSTSRQLYEEGVRFGCWGMSLYSLSCACYSLIIEKLIGRFGAKKTYIGGTLFYSLGMLLMALTRHKYSVIIFSWTAGVMYSTLFTMPYLLIANYHSKGTFKLNPEGLIAATDHVRGLGTDVAIVSSMVFLGQFILSLCMGPIVSLAGTTTAVVGMSSFLSFCGAISATQIMYLDL